MKTVTLTVQEYKDLSKKAETNEDLLIKLVMGLEDIKAGRIREWTQ